MNEEKIARRFRRHAAQKRRAEQRVEARRARKERRRIDKLTMLVRRRIERMIHFRPRVVDVQTLCADFVVHAGIVTLEVAGERVVVDAQTSLDVDEERRRYYKWDRFDVTFEDDSTLERYLNAASGRTL